MDGRAEELLARSGAEGRRLSLFVSGGVDSTAMTVAFLKAADGNFENLAVVYTKYSEQENPEFFELLKRMPGLTLKKVQPSRGLDDAQEEAMRDGYALPAGARISFRKPDQSGYA